MSLVKKSACAVLLMGSVGCAHIPDAKVGYYIPQTRVTVKVNRTVACADKEVVIIDAVTPLASHSASSRFIEFPLKPLRGMFSDIDVKFDFYDDGRLKNINSTSTGQGETILKTFVNIATTLAGVRMADRPANDTDCELINRIGNKQPVSLVYEGEIKMDVAGKQLILPDIGSATKAIQLSPAIGAVCASFEKQGPGRIPVTRPAEEGDVLLTVRQPGFGEFKVSAMNVTCQTEKMKIWDGKLVVAQAGEDYVLPMPAPSVFGKQQLVAAFHESGALSSVQFVANTGAGQALNALSSALTAIQDETARKTREMNAEADLIRAQQRLAKCRADPANCS